MPAACRRSRCCRTSREGKRSCARERKWPDGLIRVWRYRGVYSKNKGCLQHISLLVASLQRSRTFGSFMPLVQAYIHVAAGKVDESMKRESLQFVRSCRLCTLWQGLQQAIRFLLLCLLCRDLARMVRKGQPPCHCAHWCPISHNSRKLFAIDILLRQDAWTCT